MRHSTLLMAACAGFAFAACDSDSPVQPDSSGPALFSRVDAGSSFTASAISASEIDLTWQQQSSPQVNGYQVFRSTTGPTGSYSLIASTSPTATSYADAGLTVSTQYCYEIRSFKTAGKNTTYSAYSAAACATTLAPPPPPVNAPSDVDVVSVPDPYYVDTGGSNILVSWRDNSANEDGFRVERASAAIGPWTVAEITWANTTWSFEYAPREQQVCFRIIASNVVGASSPSPADCTTPPANPTNLVAKAVDRQSIALTWMDNSAVEDGYKVSRLDATGTWTGLAVLPANAVNYRDAAATADRTYTYRVQAMKDGGLSDYSNESVAVISTIAPAVPSIASASYWADNEYGWLYFAVTWTDASNNEEGFRIESSADGVSGWQMHAIVAANASSLNEQSSLWDSLTPLSGCYRVVAFNGAGESTPSNVTCTEWYNPPTNLTATAVDQQSIDLKWTDNARFEYDYVVFRSTSVYGPYDVVGQTPANATSYHDTGLASGQEYWYFVASDFGGNSIYDGFEYSDFASATTLSATVSATLSMQTSRTVINDRLTPIHVRGRPTLQNLRARYAKSQTATAIVGGGVTPMRIKQPVRQMPRIRGHKAP
jgi:hypothetical protein